MKTRVIVVILSCCSLTWARQPSAPPAVAAPLRDLPWGQINFLHTTDTHGWHAGHLQEASYGADWGDYISFAERMREKADRDGVDLLLVDTGDRVEGNGLYDSSDPPGKYTQRIIKEQQIDLICSGNHELYKKNTSELEYEVTVANFKDSYLASNIDIYDPVSGELVPLARRYKKFTTKNQGIRIMAFAFLFDFTGNYNNTVIHHVADVIKEKWFQEAIRDREVDLFVIIGHSAVRSREFGLLYKAVRAVRWDTPIQFFGGHFHIRDYTKYDSKAYGLASGRYLESIGFQSISGVHTAATDESDPAAPTFARRYIDNNLLSFYHHTGLNSSTFPTEHGLKVSRYISDARSALRLDEVIGCAPVDLYTNRAPYPHNNSIYSWLEEDVLPAVISDPVRASVPRLAIVNTGALRFDIFEGAFTTDTTYIVSPFTSAFRYIKDVPYERAKHLIRILNQEDSIVQQADSDSTLQSWMLAPLEQLAYSHDIVAAPERDTASSRFAAGEQQMYFSPSFSGNLELTPGYTTIDDAGSDGDDTVHSPISFYRVPNCIEARINFPDSTEHTAAETVDIIYIDFIEPWILLGLKQLGLEYETADTDVYMNGTTFTSALSDWIGRYWKSEC